MSTCKPASSRLRRGSAATIAMVYLVLMSTLALGMFYTATLNTRGASAVADMQQARALAESGLRWQVSRLRQPSVRPRTTKGNISAADADDLWPLLRDRVAADWRALPGTPPVVSEGPGFVEADAVVTPAGLFRLRIERLDGYSTDPSDPAYRQFARLLSTGIVRQATDHEVERTVAMNLSLDKRINFAVVGKTRIQLGRNTLVEGPVAMGTGARYSPYLILSDFKHFDPWLEARVTEFENFLKAEHDAYNNRISVNHPTEYAKALEAGFADVNGDGWIDEFDLLLERFDATGDGRVTRAEFTNPSTGELYEADLWAAIDNLGAPMFDGDVVRAGYRDDVICSNDFYAKVRGTVSMIDTAEAWQAWLDRNGGHNIQDLMRGPLIPARPDDPTVVFGATPADMIDLNPANFEQAAENFRTRSGPDAGVTRRQTRDARDAAGNVIRDSRNDPVQETSLIENAVLSLTDASRSSASSHDKVVERTPWGSTSYQATYERPVFRDMHLKNVQIPKGMNALFENCTFEGVTFIDMHRDIVVSGQVRYDSSSGMTWSRRMKSGGFNRNTTLTSANSHGFSDGNNVRFDGCTFNGPLVGPYATAYTHFSNSWEFTGETKFDNVHDQTATIVCPQTNIEMGSFERPGDSPSTLVGVVVAGNIDIRGTSVVDGSIIVTGDGAGNTTLGWFGPSDDSTDASAMPETGGFGRLNIRYNPYRALPDGIDIAVTIEPVISTYEEL